MSHLELMRDEGRSLASPPEPQDLTSARVWQCKFRSLQALSTMTNLETLVIATYPDETFEPLAALTRLRYLSVLHFPHVSDLGPLSELLSLDTLSLSSLPSWDVSDKVLQVESLAPLTALARLRHLELFGVRPPDQSLAALTTLPALQTARFSQFPDDEIAAFYAKTGVRNEFNPDPVFDAA